MACVVCGGVYSSPTGCGAPLLVVPLGHCPKRQRIPTAVMSLSAAARPARRAPQWTPERYETWSKCPRMAVSAVPGCRFLPFKTPLSTAYVEWDYSHRFRVGVAMFVVHPSVMKPDMEVK
jgi:hypothetical protein